MRQNNNNETSIYNEEMLRPLNGERWAICFRILWTLELVGSLQLPHNTSDFLFTVYSVLVVCSVRFT